MNVYKFNVMYNDPANTKVFTFKEIVLRNKIVTFVFNSKDSFSLVIPIKVKEKSRKRMYRAIVVKKTFKKDETPIKITEENENELEEEKTEVVRNFVCPCCQSSFTSTVEEKCPTCQSSLILSDSNEYVQYFN